VNTSTSVAHTASSNYKSPPSSTTIVTAEDTAKSSADEALNVDTSNYNDDDVM